jgi:uncharacterized protein YgiM (DUF1202 family)
LDEKRIEFDERLKKRQEFAERDIATRYNDLELEEERKNKELSEFHGMLKKKEEEFFSKLTKEKEWLQFVFISDTQISLDLIMAVSLLF